jgi:hypothetical protein
MLEADDPTSRTPDSSRVLGVVVEIGLQEGAFLIAGYANGDARLLYSNGGGLLGDLYEYPNIAEAARSVVDVAQPLLDTLPVESELPPLPAADMVRVAILTINTRHATQVPGPAIVHPQHPLNKLFSTSNDLATELFALQKSLNESPSK